MYSRPIRAHQGMYIHSLLIFFDESYRYALAALNDLAD